MIYDFIDSRGQTHGFHFPMGKAPEIGSRIKRGGRIYRRIPSKLRAVDNTREFISYSLPRWYKGAKRHTKDGKPIFTHGSQVKDTMAWSRHNDFHPDNELIYD